MRHLISLFLVFACLGLQAQKSIRKSIVNPRTSWVHIDTEHCFELLLENSDSEEVIIQAKIDGEYSDDLLIEMEEDGTTLMIRPDFRPDFRHPNDKLSAHKVISIHLLVQVPEYTNVNVFGNHTQVEVNGIFSVSEFTLDDGQCTMKIEAETLMATTHSGDIYFESKGARVVAESRYGTVEGGPIAMGNGSVSLRSTSGNIYLKQGD